MCILRWSHHTSRMCCSAIGSLPPPKERVTILTTRSSIPFQFFLNPSFKEDTDLLIVSGCQPHWLSFATAKNAKNWRIKIIKKAEEIHISIFLTPYWNFHSSSFGKNFPLLLFPTSSWFSFITSFETQFWFVRSLLVGKKWGSSKVSVTEFWGTIPAVCVSPPRDRCYRQKNA